MNNFSHGSKIIFLAPLVMILFACAYFPPAAADPSAEDQTDEKASGSLHFLLEVDPGALIQDELEALQGRIRITLRRARIDYSLTMTVVPALVQVTINDPDQISASRDILAEIMPGVRPDPTSVNRLLLVLSDETLSAIREATINRAMVYAHGRACQITPSPCEAAVERVGQSYRFELQFPTGFDDGKSTPHHHSRPFGQINFHSFDATITSDLPRSTQVPAGSLLLPAIDGFAGSNGEKQFLVRRRVLFSSNSVLAAWLHLADDGTFEVHLKLFDSALSTVKSYVGQNIAAVVGQRVIATPLLDSPDDGQTLVIRDDFSLKDAQDFVKTILGGAAPPPLKIVREWTVKQGG